MKVFNIFQFYNGWGWSIVEPEKYTLLNEYGDCKTPLCCIAYLLSQGATKFNFYILPQLKP